MLQRNEGNLRKGESEKKGETPSTLCISEVSVDFVVKDVIAALLVH